MKKILVMFALCLAGISMATAQVQPNKVSALSTYSDGFIADNAFDDDMNTRWAAEDWKKFPEGVWIQADYKKSVTISKVSIEEFTDRISKFALQYLDGKEWKNCLEGTTIGQNYEKTFPAVTSKSFRLLILETSVPNRGPSIFEIALYK